MAGEEAAAMESTPAVSADGALLWLLHTLLRARWWPAGDEHELHAPLPLEPRAFAGNVALLPALKYRLAPQRDERQQDDSRQSCTTVDVRAIRVQQKLFVHFVSAGATVRLPLLVRDYVKPAAPGDYNTTPSTGDRVLRVGTWRCNQELLRWRLERNVFSALSPQPLALRMRAELSQLAEPVLTRVYSFLRAPEFVRVAQTNKYLHQLAESAVLWHQFLQQDFPATAERSLAQEKLQYVALYEEKVRRDRAREAMLHLATLWDTSAMRGGRHGGRGGGHDPFVPPAQPAVWFPPSPFRPVFPGETAGAEGWRGTRRGRPDFDLEMDIDLRLAFDRRRQRGFSDEML